MGKKQGVAFHADPVYRSAGQRGGVDVRALEPFVPISLVVNDPAVHVLLPERGAAVSAQSIESEGVQFQARGEAEAVPDIRSVSPASRRQRTLHPGDAMPFGFADRALNLRGGLLLLQPVQDLLRARFHAKRQEIAVGLLHNRQLIDRHRICPAFAAPVELEVALHDAPTDVADPFPVKEKMIVGQVKGAIALIVELLQFAQDVFRGPVPPCAFRQRRNIAVNAGVGAAPGGLHGAEFIQGEDRGGIQG